jgi:subtilisin family serine protease/subtilisin-like proprotein convertase family protein
MALGLLLIGALSIVVFLRDGDRFFSKELGKPLPKNSFDYVNNIKNNNLSRNPNDSSPFRDNPSNVYSATAPSKSIQSTIGALAPLLAESVTLEDGGAKREFQLSTSELSIRDRDGERRVIALTPTDSAEAFAATIEKIRSESGNEPELVLYPVGLPRDEFTRRIVTRDVVITASSRSQADAIADSESLEFQRGLVFAPGSYVYEAPTSLAALAMELDERHSEAVATQLASRAQKMAMPNDPFIHLQWHLKYQKRLGSLPDTDINVESVWNYPSTSTSNSTRGHGVVIGIVDDGMDWNHLDLRPNVLRSLQKDWNGKDNDPTPNFFVFPPQSHGTACAGVAAARGNNRIGVSGVAPEANLAGMRLIAGPSTDLEDAEAMTWKLGQIHILSNSWGRRVFFEDSDGVFQGWFPIAVVNPLTESALKYAADFGRNGKGTIIAFAAGNADELLPSLGASPIKSGARVDFQALPNSIYTIAVGAVDSTGVKSNYSQIGSSLLISAPSLGASPSLGIMTTDNRGRYGYNKAFAPWDFPSSGDVSLNFSGTSAACPIVSGVVALMLQRNPNLGWRDVQEILIRSAAQVDVNDPEWITANRTDHVTGNKTVEFHFNDKYGAGLVDAAAAVDLAGNSSGNWTNLKPQISRTVTRTVARRIDPANSPRLPVNQTFSVGAPNIRTEHVTLELNITDIPKGNLTITLISPTIDPVTGNRTTSTFCLPHSDSVNTLQNWKFMSVRHWGEEASGTWQLSIDNNSSLTGNLTRAELVVYGSELPNSTPTPSPTPTLNPPPTVTLVPSITRATISTNITLNATAVALSANGNVTGNITGVQFFATANGSGNATLIGNGTLTANSSLNPASYTLDWNTSNLTAGNYSITAVASTSGNLTGTSNAVSVLLETDLVAGWDFQTATRSTVPLTTALYSRTYRSNFGRGNATLLMNGSNGSSRWDVSAGEIFAGAGSDLNLGAGFSSVTSNPAALLLRGGRNLSANGKSLVFQVDLTKCTRLVISYAVQGSPFGFTTHEWEFFDTAAQIWRPIATRTIANTPYTVETLPRVVASTGFYGNANARVRLRLSGATRIEGTNLLDNITFTATRLP